jgi:hypothetical protein
MIALAVAETATDRVKYPASATSEALFDPTAELEEAMRTGDVRLRVAIGGLGDSARPSFSYEDWHWQLAVALEGIGSGNLSGASASSTLISSALEAAIQSFEVVRDAGIRAGIAATALSRAMATSTDCFPWERNMRMQDALTETLRKIDAFGELEPDWDSYGGKAISAGAIDSAKRFLQVVTSLTPPQLRSRALAVWVAPVPNGHVLLEWHGSEADLEVEVTETGDVDLLLASRTDGRSEYREEMDVGPQDVALLLDRVLSA